MNRDEILSLLKRFKAAKGGEYRIKRIGLFGSAARQGVKEHSDIDVVVELGTQDLFALIGIKQELEAELEKRVDIVSYRKEMNEFLRNRIDREALYV